MANVIVYIYYRLSSVMSHPVMANCPSIKLAIVTRAMLALNKPKMIPKHVPIHSMHRPEHRYIKSFAIDRLEVRC